MRGRIVAESVGGREIAVYLPPSYAAGEAKYPVVYVQDGSYLFESSMEELEGKFARGELRELIFVGIEPISRNDEYTPWFAPALSDKFADFGGKGADYLSFVAGELKPWVDEKYRTSRRPEETGIIGASLGGLISLYAAYLFPGVFGRFGLLSASFWFPGMIGYVRAEPIAAVSRKIYMYVGSAEGIDKRNIQSTMVPHTKEAFAILSERGFSGERLRLEIEDGASHKAAYFIKRFPEAMAWLFPAEIGS
ncbi:alpha/beta hydrolase [Paenibacillus ehimensis]|uniref:alpha/beta hydrolase n=1 Tax=Paenibacillus ehimensis TaxID=79264 RepID=UPI000FD7C7AD|nr:alpha/beta hydrolase-fold protein [Paenibacillus ehimensis]